MRSPTALNVGPRTRCCPHRCRQPSSAVLDGWAHHALPPLRRAVFRLGCPARAADRSSHRHGHRRRLQRLCGPHGCRGRDLRGDSARRPATTATDAPRSRGTRGRRAATPSGTPDRRSILLDRTEGAAVGGVVRLSPSTKYQPSASVQRSAAGVLVQPSLTIASEFGRCPVEVWLVQELTVDEDGTVDEGDRLPGSAATA